MLLTLLEQVSWDKFGGFSSVLYLSKLSKSQITCVAEIRESNNYLTFITRKSWYSFKKKRVLLLGNFIGILPESLHTGILHCS